MAVKDVAGRRAIRKLEAKRDDLIEKQKKTRVELAKTREELKHAKRR